MCRYLMRLVAAGHLASLVCPEALNPCKALPLNQGRRLPVPCPLIRSCCPPRASGIVVFALVCTWACAAMAMAARCCEGIRRSPSVGELRSPGTSCLRAHGDALSARPCLRVRVCCLASWIALQIAWRRGLVWFCVWFLSCFSLLLGVGFP